MFLSEKLIIERVRTLLDLQPEYRPIDGFAADSYGSIQEVITGSIPMSIRSVLLVAPVHIFGGVGVSLSGIPLQWDSGTPGFGSGWLQLPNDFLRLVIFRMSDWVCAVSTAITQESPLYYLQRSPYAGLRGTRQKPIVAIVPNSRGKILEFYSCQTQGAHLLSGLYLPEPKLQSGGYNIPDELYDAICLKIAIDASLVLGETSRSEALLPMLKEQLA